MLFTVNADESVISKDGQLEFLVLAAYIGTKAQWQQFGVDWRCTLDKYQVRNFHFREFHAKPSATDPGSPYFQWPSQKRDDYFYDLALAVGANLVPVGGAYSAKVHREHCLPGEVIKHLFGTFFRAVCEALDRHWPDPRGSDFSNKVHFVFDNNHKKWREALAQVYDGFAAQDPRFGGMAFEDDTDPVHIGLQAADFLAAIYRQTAERQFKTGKHQRPRLIDFILFRNLDPVGGVFNFSQVAHPIVFRAMVEEFRKCEKQQKMEWANNGIIGMTYYPADHLESIAAALKKRAPEIAPRLMKELLTLRQGGQPGSE